MFTVAVGSNELQSRGFYTLKGIHLRKFEILVILPNDSFFKTYSNGDKSSK